MSKELHIAVVTRNVNKASGETSEEQTSQVSSTLRGAVYFQSQTLMDGEYPEPAVPSFGFASALGAGLFWVPSVNDTILVEIDNSLDVPMPRYLCCLYNNENEIHEEFAINYPNRKGWITNSGHKLLFDDTEDQEYLKLEHAYGTKIEMDRYGNLLETVLRDFRTEIRLGRDLVVRKNNKETILGKSFVEIGKDEERIVHGNSKTTVIGDYELEVQGKYKFSISALEQQFGSLLQTVKGAAQFKVGGGWKQIVGGALSTSVISNRAASIGGSDSKLVAMTADYTYGAGRTEKVVAGKMDHQVLAGQYLVTVMAGMITIQTLAGIATFGTATGKLMIDPAGIISLLGTITKVGAGTGMVLTTMTAPLVDNITGAPHIGLPTFLAG